MPAREIMKKFRKGKLHSGKSGKIVRNKKQAKAILLSYLRKEGRIGPQPESKKRSKKSSIKKSRKKIAGKR
jgi:hypothetical protein